MFLRESNRSTALKTLALRLRGAKTELEKAGEDVEGMAENTSQLQAKLKALTHGKVDIMLNADTFKSTTQILREMSAAWEDMTDIERASALELMGGKRQANILSSVITNFETVEDVIETSMNSSGSAIAENEKWLDSIEGKTYQFTNALQTMWSNMLDSEVIKGFIEFGTNAIQFLDTGVGKVVALVAALKLIAKFKGFSIGGIAQGFTGSINKIITAQQTLQTMSKISPVTGALPTESINAYAKAVAGLTAKQQANLLASQNLTKQDIQRVLQTNQCTDAEQREALAHVHTSTTKQQETAASQALFAAQTQELAVTYQSAAADLTEADAEQAKLAAKILSEAASKNLTKAELLEKITQSSLTDETKAQIIAKLGLTSVNHGLAASIKAIYTANPVGFWITLGSTILSLIPIISSVTDTFTKSAEEIKQEAKEIKQAYSDVAEEVNNNLKTLGATDALSIDTLEKEFASLTAGVDKYGNNLSLTSDQYERYKEICEQIVGINPKIASGYDSATEAIGNNANALSQLIELQKIQQRNAVKEMFSDENRDILASDIFSDIDTYKKDNPLPQGNTKWDFGVAFKNALADSGVLEYSLFKKFTDKYKLNFDWNDYGSLDVNHMSFGQDYMEAIIKDLQSSNSILANYFSQEYINQLLAIGDQYYKNISTYESKMNEFKDGLIDTLLQVPYGEESYDNLDSSSKGFIADWIKNSEIFKIDPNATEEEIDKQLDDNIALIQDFVNKFADESIQASITALKNLDESSVTAREHLDQVRGAALTIWNSIGGENNTYGFKSKTDIEKMLGVDAEAEAKKWSDAITSIQGYLGDKVDVAGQFNYQTMTRQQMNAFLGIPWDEIGAENINSVADVWERIRNAIHQYSSAIKTYSALSDTTDNYDELLSQTKEIRSDNTAVTQEYKDALLELGVTEEDLKECFDENNGLIVKNAKALNNLVKSTGKNIANNVKLAKSQARLEYYNLVKQLNSALDGTKKLDAATRDAVYSTIAQIDAVQKAIYQYQLLEDSLLGAQNAFKDFNDAKEIDDLNTYGDSYVEMVQTMYDGLFKTGKVGTEQFWAAVEATVPDEIYQSYEKDFDRMKAIYDYFNKNILPTLRLDEDQLSMDYASIENFIKKALDAKVIKGDRKNFDLVDGMNLEEAAKLLDMTQAQTYAFFAELDKYNTSSTEPSFLLQLDDSLEGRIAKVTNNMEDLNKRKLALLEDGDYDKHQKEIDEINTKLTNSQNELRALGEEAYSTWQEYTKNDVAIAALSELEDKQRLITEKQANTIGVEWDEVKGQTVQQVLDNLLAKQLKLEEPTVVTAQLSIDYIDLQIAELEEKLKKAEEDPTVLNVKVDASDAEVEAAKQEVQEQIQALQEGKVAIATTYNIALSEEDKKELQDELNAIEQFKIHDKEFTVVAKGTSEVMRLLDAVNQYAKDITKTVTTEYKTVYTSDNKQYSGWTHTPGSGGRYTHVDGTAHANGTAFKNGSWGAPRTETALVGELGPELLVRNGRWHTIGENGAEFTQVQRGDIIFNHKQTEDLLSKGYVTGRGSLKGGSSAFASGTAYSGSWRPTSQGKEQSNKPGHDFTETGNRLFNATDSLADAADLISQSSDEFREVFDWIEVRLEEINEDISLRSAQLENKVGYSAQNKTVDKIIDLNQKLYDNLIAGSNKYYAYANKLLSKVPAEYRKAAQDGTIAIETFVGEADEKTLEAIQDYREWIQKGDEAVQQAEETLTEISNLAKQAVDNIASQFENEASIRENKTDQLDAHNALLETTYGTESENIYKALIEINKTNITELKKQRDAMQKQLNSQVEAGNIKKYSQDWYDAVNDIAALDTEIIELTANLNDLQDAINEIHWYYFDLLISQFEAVSDEAENLIDILGTKDVVDEMGNWTDEGITALGLYAQQMEVAQKQAEEYAAQIKYLNANWEKLGYTEEEYLDKLDELKSGQYDAIQAYHDSKDAIVDLNKERIDAIKEGIEKEIEAYEELIEKKKEELDAEQDLYDFQKKIRESTKDIADLERQIAALSADNSASARAKRAQLQAELAEAQQNLQDQYYERSVSNQQEALDKELENFKEEKDAEIEGWEKYLEDTEMVVSDSLAVVQSNTDTVLQTLNAMGQEYSLNITESLTSPWENGSVAISNYQTTFGNAVSETMDKLDGLSEKYNAVTGELAKEVEKQGLNNVNQVNQNAKEYQNQSKKEESNKKEENTKKEEAKTIKVGGKINAGSAKIYEYVGDKSGSKQYYAKDPIYNVLSIDGNWVKVRHHKSSSGVTGWFKKGDIKAYAKGAKSIDEDQLALIDELGDELQLVPGQNGRLEYVKKGTGIIPADLTERLMNLAMDPQSMLDANRPSVGLHPEIHNTEINLDITYGDMVSIGEFHGDNIADLEKMVEKQFEKHTKNLNNALRRYTR